MSRRVVVTGLGVISALGLDVNTFWTNIINGKSGVSLVESFDTTEFQTKIAAEVKDFDPTDYLEKKDARHMDRFHPVCCCGCPAGIDRQSTRRLRKKMPTRLVWSSVPGSVA